MEAEAAAEVAGEELVHGDVRSDNLCFVGDRTVLVDWNWAGRGNGVLDIAGLLPSLHREGRPLPDTVLPEQPHMAGPGQRILCRAGWASRRARFGADTCYTAFPAASRATVGGAGAPASGQAMISAILPLGGSRI
jgi:aminoglycoside phosphotransferase (APT) family kinase protein